MRQTTKDGPRPGMTTTDLTTSQQRLVTLMREIRFGRIEGLTVADGEPVFQDPTTVFRDFKFGAGDDVTPAKPNRDFALKVQVTEMLDHLRRMRDGVVEILEIKNGLPFRMSVKETIGA